MPAVALQAAIIRATEACGQSRLWDRLPELRELVDGVQASTADERSALAVARGFCAFAADDFDAAFPALEEALRLGAESDGPAHAAARRLGGRATRATSCSRRCSRHAPTVSRARRERSAR